MNSVPLQADCTHMNSQIAGRPGGDEPQTPSKISIHVPYIKVSFFFFLLFDRSFQLFPDSGVELCTYYRLWQTQTPAP